MAHAASQLKKKADLELTAAEEEKEKKRRSRKRSREGKKKWPESERGRQWPNSLVLFYSSSELKRHAFLYSNIFINRLLMS
ncbi:hypothetical protein KOW79_011873 [Hemibagrus wyckioides]|uniref:Uncharacterized protein n=1 Tax=Hemibagrus wyckioides TaxID=337641 RepID=A0A9D3NNP6_9TELE|nr:hypothetical protein KOW79_011873 [Hemibagrus wyckioides]